MTDPDSLSRAAIALVVLIVFAFVAYLARSGRRRR